MRKLLLALGLVCLVAFPWLLPPSASVAQNTQCSDRPTGDSSNACANTRFVNTASGGGGPQRKRLTAATDYYVSKGGNDNCDGTANVRAASGSCSWLTVGKALTYISQSLDFGGNLVIVHVQGTTDPSGSSTGIYTENLSVPTWIGYDEANGFSQLRILGENGTVTFTSSSATAVLFGTRTSAPATFENITFTNPAASGILVYMDDYGFVSLKGCTLGATGAGGLKINSTLFSNILLQNSTFQIAGDAGALFRSLNGSFVTAQPGAVFNTATATTYAFTLVSVDKTSAFINDTTSFTGTTPTGVKFTLEAGGKISDTTTIAGTSPGVVTPWGVGDGGSGAVTLSGILQGNGTSPFTGLSISQLAALFTKPTVQIFLSGTNQTYTKSANATWIEVEIVGGGGGGAGSGTTPVAATAGGASCWNSAGVACTTPIYMTSGGALGSTAGAATAAGGVVSGSASCSDSQPGGSGGAGGIVINSFGGQGGSSRYGGAGTLGWGGANNATAAATNSGSGGGGAGENATNNAGGGGGAGAWCYVLIPSPTASYTYTIGTAGNAGTAGGGGNNGGGGAAGKIRVIEHYN